MQICRMNGCDNPVESSHHRVILCDSCRDKLISVSPPSCESAGTLVNKMVQRAKARSKKKSIPFNITMLDVYDIWPSDYKCKYTGLDLDASSGITGRYFALDRIDPALGYVPGNIQVISYAYNSFKADMDDAVAESLFAEVVENYNAKSC